MSVSNQQRGIALGEYIDIHSHFAPGFDDGAAQPVESLEILLQAQQAGFGLVLATPHLMAGVYEHPRSDLAAALAELEPGLQRESPGLKLGIGAEYYLDENFYAWLAQGDVFPLGDGNHVLCELPMLKLPPMAKEFAFRMQIKGFTPVLAHPERYADIVKKPQRIEELVHVGYRVQINLGSLTGMYGRKTRRAAHWMLKNGLVDFAASDAHTPKQAADVYHDGVAALRELVGEAGVRELLIDNPQAALAEDKP
jgi:protein-tyrosine phosphatase